MSTYTGPVPPPPGTNADAATWQNWWSYQIMLQNLRYEDERAARAVVLDEQHRQKMAAEAACAAAQTRVAEAQAAATAAMLRIHTTPPAEAPAAWTDEQIVRQLMFSMSDAVPQGTAAMSRALSYLRTMRVMYPPPLVVVDPTAPKPPPGDAPPPLPPGGQAPVPGPKP